MFRIIYCLEGVGAAFLFKTLHFKKGVAFCTTASSQHWMAKAVRQDTGLLGIVCFGQLKEAQSDVLSTV